MSIIEPISKIVAYVSSGDDKCLDAICENNLVDYLYRWLANETFSASLKADVLWCLSNMTISSEKYINQAIPSEKHYNLLL